ncbi:S8 family serine peptidase [Lysobacter auxotrophicus]|uniref:S8 family serine peptidase n=1 Tax=Lysobacter auxotrophicus TaxID=2992573 RepID=A0ABN6UHB3_9GAMM|nr:S8 family serine peptidase [Lysobacter auxotrophicus]
MSSNDRSRRLRAHALSIATAIALSSALAAPALAQQARVNLSGLDAQAGSDRFIVKYRDGSAERANVATLQSVLSTAARTAGAGKALGVRHVRRIATGADVVRADRKLDRVEAESLMRQIASDPNVEYVEVDKINRAFLTPNDTRYSEQWGYSGTYGIKANQAWDVTNGAGSVVAVLDTGITSHSDLSANVLPGYDFIIDTTVSNDGNGRDSDPSDPGDWVSANQCGGTHAAQPSSWHGTHVAGTIAAVTNNAKGVAGVAYGAKIVPVRVLGTCGGYDSDIADAIIWASGGTVSGVPANANPAEVINLSLGGSGACGTTTQNAINSAVSRGTTLVIAAGNDNTNVSNASPANCSNVIAVASITSTGARSSFSNYGSLIDIAAPGSNILSTLNSGSTSPGAETYASYNGTSMATPHVAGVVALLQAAATTPKTPAQVESIIKANVTAFPSTPSQPIGPGILNAKAVVDAANGTTPPPTGTLTNGTPVTGLSGSAGTELRYTLVVPSGATGLKFVTAGGTGDADLFVKFGSAPTTSSYDCKSEGSTNAETCNIATAQAGTYHVLVRGYSTFSGLSLTGSYTAGGGGGTQTYTNGTDYTISDNATVDSPITVSGRSGNAPTNASVTVAIVHTYQGDLKVDLVAPDGSLYNIHNRSGGSADNVNKTVTFNLSSEALNGTWKLRVNDNAAGDTGYINSWSVTF